MIFKKGSIRRSLRYSIWDGVFSSMMSGVSDTYLIPYAIAIGAGASQIAFLASVPALLASLLQMRSAELTQSIGSRTKLINRVVFFHAAAWLPVILIPYLFPRARLGAFGPWALLLAATVLVSFGTFGGAAWQSLMSDYIPVAKRGKYFGWRNRIQGAATVCVAVGAGVVLHYFGKDSMLGFTLIFTFAMVSRFMAWGCLMRMTEPFRHTSHDMYFSFIDFVKGLPTRNFTRFVFFISLMSLAVNISSPLLSVFLLKDLGFGYLHYMVVVTTATCSTFLFQGLWGKYGDRLGNLRMLKVSGWGVAVIPVLWLISHSLWYLFFVQLFAGACWGGFNLLLTNFMMEAVSPEKRIRCISYFNVVNNFGVFFGAALGGTLIHHLPAAFGYSYLALFLVSCIGRVGVMLLMAKTVREVRCGLDGVRGC